MFKHCRACHDRVIDREELERENIETAVRCHSCNVPMTKAEALPQLLFNTIQREATQTYWCPQCWKERHLKPSERTMNKNKQDGIHKVVVV
jgi:uncharacterized protein with PIN domain